MIFRREIAAAENAYATGAQRITEYREQLMHPFYAAERGLVDDVIDPAEPRSVLIRSLTMLARKHRAQPARKHGNQPR